MLGCAWTEVVGIARPIPEIDASLSETDARSNRKPPGVRLRVLPALAYMGGDQAAALMRLSITCQTSLSNWFSFQMP